MQLSKVAILDVDSIAYACGNPNKVLDSNGIPVKVLSEKGNMVFQYVDKTEEELKQSCDSVMTDILNACGCDSYIGYIKGINTTNARVKVNPEYKATRNKEQPKWWHKVEAHLVTIWGVQFVSEMEVDDAVNITRLQVPDSFLVAIDNDLLALEGTHFNWRTKEWITVTKEQATRKFWSDMICGQKGDNIKGIPGKGEAFVNRAFRTVESSEEQYYEAVLYNYITHFGEYEGIKEFYKNYISLKILDSKEGFTPPEPIVWKKKEIINTEELFK